MQSTLSLLNPQARQIANNMNNKSNTEKAQYIADFCNKNGITKNQLKEFINHIS